MPQSIAVTGAIDQFGLVHSVGGVNEKIEGFFTICERRGLTGHQGVIIPTTVLNQLSLSETVVSAVKKWEVFIWTVDDVFPSLSNSHLNVLYYQMIKIQKKHQSQLLLIIEYNTEQNLRYVYFEHYFLNVNTVL